MEVLLRMMKLIAIAWSDFARHPDDWEKFDALDIVLRTFVARWGSYALARRVSATRADNGLPPVDDDIIDLLG